LASALLDLVFSSEIDDFLPFLDYFQNQLRNVLEPSKKGTAVEFLTCLFLDLITRRKEFEEAGFSPRGAQDRFRQEVEWLRIGMWREKEGEGGGRRGRRQGKARQRKGRGRGREREEVREGRGKGGRRGQSLRSPVFLQGRRGEG
jgi:hypothetical protein